MPFYLRCGKRLGKRVTEIAVVFKRAPHLPFEQTAVRELGKNAIVIRVQPDEGVTMRFGAKVPGGSTMEVRDVNMDFSYGRSFTENSPEAYERLILDVLLEIFPERYITPAVVGVTLLGWGVTLVWEAPFCIAQGMVSLPYLYIGYLAKKRRLFETPLSGRAKAGLIAAALGVVAGVLLTQSTDCVSLGEWTMASTLWS